MILRIFGLKALGRRHSPLRWRTEINGQLTGNTPKNFGLPIAVILRFPDFEPLIAVKIRG
jgi:hypothetical protein